MDNTGIGVNRRTTDSKELYDETTKIAREHKCDRGTFSVCWPEYEDGKTCICREEAKRALGISAEKAKV